MTRWAEDPDGAADALILRSLPDIAVAGRVLLAGTSRSLPAALDRLGAAWTAWSRRLGDGTAGGDAAAATAAWPPAGPFDLALVRLPKAREEAAMTVHAALSVLAAGGRHILYGGNDEGIRPAAALLEQLTGAVATLAARGHGRVLAARRPEDRTALGASLAAWRTVSDVEIAGVPRAWASYPGCFAAGRLDEGTALLLAHLPAVAPGERVLDYGCGTGPIAAAVLARQPAARVDGLDSDSVALSAASENVPAARLVLGTRLADAGRGDYAAILSNPPLHQGIAEDHRLLERLVADAPRHLAPGGHLRLVVQRRLGLERLLAQRFARVDMLAQTSRFRVWTAATPLQPARSP